MEKYSAYRDPGTGIQPFLTPVPPQGADTVAIALKPLLYTLGVIRTLLIILIGVAYLLLVRGVCLLLSPVPFVYNLLAYFVTALLSRVALVLAGVFWINVETVKRKRGRGSPKETWAPDAGDIIISNWISWPEILWLAFRFNPVFALPIAAPVEKPVSTEPKSSRSTPGRKTGTGSAAISMPSHGRTTPKRAQILGFREVSLLNIIRTCGHVPPYGISEPNSQLSLEDVRLRAKKSGRAIAIFPECTTSNGRGMLRFAAVFKGVRFPVQSFKIFIMCVRIDSPTALTPTLSLAIPPSLSLINPIPHVFSVASSILPLTLSIRLLSPSDSPSSSTFLLSDVIASGVVGEDVLSEACSILASDVGRLKRTGMGWEDKSMFLDFYRAKSSR